MVEKQLLLDQLNAQVKGCQACPLHKGRTNTVFGEGNINADLMFVGEGPGKDEDESGRPFVGRAGNLLTKMIESIGFIRSQVYIANIVKCRPPLNRKPTEFETEKCEHFLFEQIEIIKPKVILLLGATAFETLCRHECLTISKARGRCYTNRILKYVYIPTFHPAYLLRNQKAKYDAWEDLKLAKSLLDQPPPWVPWLQP